MNKDARTTRTPKVQSHGRAERTPGSPKRVGGAGGSDDGGSSGSESSKFAWSEGDGVFPQLPSVFAFTRSMNVTSGAFFNEMPDGRETPVLVVREGYKATQAERDSDESANKVRKVVQVGVGESARLDAKALALLVKFKIRFSALKDALHDCYHPDRPQFSSAVRRTTEEFIQRSLVSEGLREVCLRITRNITNGSFLWRNRREAASVTVKICFAEEEFEFNSMDLAKQGFENYTDDEIKVAEFFVQALRGAENRSVDVTGRVDMRGDQPLSSKVDVSDFEVFPSQLYIQGKQDIKGMGRALYKLTLPDIDSYQRKLMPGETVSPFDPVIVGQAAYTARKITVRLKTIDTWYDDYEIVRRPISVEPTGASMDLMSFMRKNSSTAYGLLPRLAEIDPNSPNGMYCIASILRGGVYAGPSKNANEKKARKDKEEAMAGRGSGIEEEGDQP